MVEERSSMEPMRQEDAITRPERQRGARGVTGAVILISLGGALLLNNLGILSVNWLGLLQFWPLILILIGLDIILGGRSVIGSIAIAILALVVVFGLFFWSANGPGGRLSSGNVVTRPIEQELGSVDALEVRLELGASDATIHALDDASYAAQGEYRTDDRLEMNVEYSERGDTGVLRIAQQGEEFNGQMPYVGELELGLTDSVPVDLNVNAGVGDTTLDLRGMQISGVSIDAGVGSVELILPEEGRYSVDANAGIGSVIIDIPDDMEARITFDGGISSLDLDDRFGKIGDNVWETPGFESAENRVDMNVDSGIGSLDIH